MADLSQDELQAITDHPVGKGLETLRTIFGSRYLKSKDADVTEVVDRLTSGVSNKGEGLSGESWSRGVVESQDC